MLPTAAENAPWSGTRIEVDDDLVAEDDVALAVAGRRGVETTDAAEELAAIDERFDVDAVYLAATDDDTEGEDDPNTAGGS